MEVLFLIDVLVSFITEYQDEELQKPVRDIKKIARRYIASSFVFDVLALSTFPL